MNISLNLLDQAYMTIAKDVSYCKNSQNMLLDRNKLQRININTLNQISAKGAICGFLSPLTLIAS